MSRLSTAKKIGILPYLIKRDGSFTCFYCHKELSLENHVMEHLNGNDTDNRIENLVISCQSCNIKKPFDNELREVALNKFRENLSQSQTLEANLTCAVSTEVTINQTNYEITKKLITERVVIDQFLEFSEALNSCTFICKEKTGHGSQQSIRNYIAALTCAEGPFMITKNENGKNIIVKRHD